MPSAHESVSCTAYIAAICSAAYGQWKPAAVPRCASLLVLHRTRARCAIEPSHATEADAAPPCIHRGAGLSHRGVMVWHVSHVAQAKVQKRFERYGKGGSSVYERVGLLLGVTSGGFILHPNTNVASSLG